MGGFLVAGELIRCYQSYPCAVPPPDNDRFAVVHGAVKQVCQTLSRLRVAGLHAHRRIVQLAGTTSTQTAPCTMPTASRRGRRGDAQKGDHRMRARTLRLAVTFVVIG